jgi:HAMP domain-containing protein
MRFDRPIRDAGASTRLGTVVAMARTDQVLPSEALSEAFGRSGYSVVLDRQSDRVVYHPRRSFMQARASVLLGSDGWEVDPGRLAADSGSIVFEMLDSVRVASFVNLDTPPWTVVATSAVDEFAGPFARMRRLQLAILAVVTVVVLLAFLLLTGRATRSLAKLTEAADAVAAGDYAPSLPPAGKRRGRTAVRGLRRHGGPRGRHARPDPREPPYGRGPSHGRPVPSTTCWSGGWRPFVPSSKARTSWSGGTWGLPGTSSSAMRKP